MINEKADEVILSRYQTGLETSIISSHFNFDCVHLLYYTCHKTSFKRSGSYMDSPNWIKNKKATIYPINKKDSKCFQYAVTVTLNHEKIGKNPEGITNTKPFIDKYILEGINYLSEKDDWKNLEKNNLIIALNVLYPKKEKIYSVYVLKHNSNREKQVILLMIPNGEGWHYIAVKKLPALLRGITSKHQGDFYCLNRLLKTLKYQSFIDTKILIKHHLLFMQILNI